MKVDSMMVTVRQKKRVIKMDDVISRTLGELYDTDIKDFSKFLQLTNGVLFSENCDGQLKMLFLDDFYDLTDYLGWTVQFIEEIDNKVHIIIKE